MLGGCSTVCPNCKHQFTCCPTNPPPTTTTSSSCCCSSSAQSSQRRSVQFLSGGGLVATTTTTTTTTLITPTSPQISPSVPLSFILPLPNGIETVTLEQLQPYQQQQPERELEKLTNIVRVLRLSGWYYENLTFNKSDELLKHTKIGTFLLRNSSDPRYLFSLSMQTERGPKSVRLYYINGYFRLDAQQHLQNFMPLFSGVIELIQYYRNKRTNNDNNNNNNNNNNSEDDHHGQVWISPNGKRSTICLEQPLYKYRRPPTLKHLTRLTINRYITDRRKLAFLELPPSLTKYIEEYPYSI